MRREDIPELHYITLVSNLPSIYEHGLLSHRRASRLTHYSIAMPEVQDRRVGKRVPGGRMLHEYVNLYFSARNPMLYKLRNQHAQLCVLQININALDLQGVVITDRNASSDWVRFFPSPEGLDHIDGELVFARYWSHENPIEYMSHKSIKCAEVLVPDHIDRSFIIGVYVSCNEARTNFTQLGIPLGCANNSDLFFM